MRQPILPFLLALAPLATADSAAAEPDRGAVGVTVRVPVPRITASAHWGLVELGEQAAQSKGVTVGMRFGNRLELGLEYTRARWRATDENQLAGRAAAYVYNGPVKGFIAAAAGIARDQLQVTSANARAGAGIDLPLGRQARLRVEGYLGRRLIVHRSDGPPIIQTASGGVVDPLIVQPETQGALRGMQAALVLAF